MATVFTRAMLDRIKEKGGWLAIFDRLGNGETLSAVAKDYDVSRSFLGRYIAKNKTLNELKHAAWKEAAGFYADRAVEVLEEVNADDVVNSKEQISKAKALSDAYRWKAEKFDKEFFGNPSAASVNIQIANIGELHARIGPMVQQRLLEQQQPKLIEATVEDSSGDVQPVQAEIIHEETQT
jgi:hypothetical protein